MTRVRECVLEPKRKPRGPVRILHLSDLHFDQHRDRADPRNDYLGYLQGQLKRLAPADDPFDLVIVTGDLVDYDVDKPKSHDEALYFARSYLTELCRQLHVSETDGLLVIPGNHDYLYRGISPRFQAPAAFAKVFGNLFQHRWYPRLNLLVASFDSNVDNSSLRFATGYVNNLEFETLETDLREGGFVEAASLAYRIALVHHHVLPIAAGEVLRPDTWFERRIGRRLIGTPELMLLRNSGHFLQFLFNHGFHLMLHGHLHRHECSNYQSFRDGHNRLLEVCALHVRCHFSRSNR